MHARNGAREPPAVRILSLYQVALHLPGSLTDRKKKIDRERARKREREGERERGGVRERESEAGQATLAWAVIPTFE